MYLAYKFALVVQVERNHFFLRKPISDGISIYPVDKDMTVRRNVGYARGASCRELRYEELTEVPVPCIRIKTRR